MADTGKQKRDRKGNATPGGAQFMGGTPARDIKAALRAEQGSGGNAKAVLVPLACLWRRDGKGGPETARDPDRPASAVYAWLSGMHRHGLDARCGRPKPGRPGNHKPGPAW